jgi:hypothetical protein
VERQTRRLFPSGKTFFGLTVEYKEVLLEELFQLSFNGKMGISEAQRLPIYQRKWFIERTIKEFKEIKKAVDKASKGKK